MGPYCSFYQNPKRSSPKSQPEESQVSVLIMDRLLQELLPARVRKAMAFCSRVLREAESVTGSESNQSLWPRREMKQW